MPKPTATLNPPNTFERASNPGVKWYRAPVYYPSIWIPTNPDAPIGQQLRRYPMEPLVNEAANTEILRLIQNDIPGTIYGLTGAAVDTTGADLPVGMNSLDTFTVRFEHNTGDRLDIIPALGSCMVGSADLGPTPLGGPAWHFQRGATIRIGVTPLRGNMRIDIVCWILEFRGPANYTLG